ncbi:MAG: YgjV family protein [Lachnospiraceae bacterium]
MTVSTVIELIGYLASVLVLISLLMSSVVKLRIINAIGAFIYVIYAITIKSYPTAIMNIFLIVINMYYLVKVAKNSPHYSVIKSKKEDAVLQKILLYYQEDIKHFFPDFCVDEQIYDACFVVFCDATPAGVMIGKLSKDTIEVSLDYSTPTYRDCSVGKFLYAKLLEQGIKRIAFCGNYEKHESYLKKVGFIKQNGIYIKDMS